MKPLGKAMKTAHAEKRDKKYALNEFLATYRATPHSSTGLAPGDILLRHGYGKDFPKTTCPNDEEVWEALEIDRSSRERRNEAINMGRRQDDVKVGDRVLTRNEKKTKFDPTFGPTPLTVTTVEHGGITCQASDGTTSRRHLDDVKPAPQTREEHAIIEEQPTELAVSDEESHTEPQHPPVQTTPTTDTTTPLQPRRGSRERRPNPKYAGYHLY
jgi:hypothetical protein